MKYRVVEIINLEPLKIGAGGNKQNQTEPTMEYIPGSTLRGAFMGGILSKKADSGSEETVRNILSKIRFYNAYPYSGCKMYTPSPRHLRVDKHKWRKEKADFAKSVGEGNSKSESKGVKLIDISKHDDMASVEKNREQRGKNSLEYRFLSARDGSLEGLSVKKTYRLHHNIKKGIDENGKLDEERNNIFRYEAMEKRQVFRAIISVEYRFEDALKALDDFISNTTRLTLGGSKTSGYGACSMSHVELSFDDYGEAAKAAGLSWEKKFEEGANIMITCISDCIFRNEKGQPSGFMRESELEKYFGKVKFEKGFIDTGITQGYNSKWGLRHPKETSVKAGSVMIYSLDKGKGMPEGELKDAVMRFEERLHGERTQDGFGWMAVNIDYPQELNISPANPFANAAQKEKKAHGNADGAENTYGKVKNTIDVITRGLSQSRKNWLAYIVEKDSQLSRGQDVDNKCAITMPKSIGSSRIRNMMGILEKAIRSFEKGQSFKCMDGGAKMTRDGLSDKKRFAVAGRNFSEIIAYLEGCENGSENGENPLESYAKNKLSTKKGSAFYAAFCEKTRDKLFLAELAHQAMYIETMRRGSGQWADTALSNTNSK